MSLPLVSVIIPTKDRYEQLLKAINSVKKQTYNNYEILVINDGSNNERYNKSIKNVNKIDLSKNSS